MKSQGVESLWKDNSCLNNLKSWTPTHPTRIPIGMPLNYDNVSWPIIWCEHWGINHFSRTRSSAIGCDCESGTSSVFYLTVFQLKLPNRTHVIESKLLVQHPKCSLNTSPCPLLALYKPFPSLGNWMSLQKFTNEGRYHKQVHSWLNIVDHSQSNQHHS